MDEARKFGDCFQAQQKESIATSEHNMNTTMSEISEGSSCL